MNCEDCNYYTEEFNIEANDNIPYCVKTNQYLKEDCSKQCIQFNNEINCYDCSERYAIFYELDDIDHYCKKYNVLLYQQQRSVLYKGHFVRDRNCKCK